MVKNLRAHLILICEAGTLVPYRGFLEKHGWTRCFNDCKICVALQDLAKMDPSLRLLDHKKNHKKTSGKVQIDMYRSQFLISHGGKHLSEKHMPCHPPDIFPNMKNRNLKI